MQYKQPGMQAMQTLQARKDAGTIKPAGMARLEALRASQQGSPMVRRGPQGTVMGQQVGDAMQPFSNGSSQQPYTNSLPRVSDGLQGPKLTRPMPIPGGAPSGNVPMMPMPGTPRVSNGLQYQSSPFQALLRRR